MQVHPWNLHLHGLAVSVFGHVVPLHGAPFSGQGAERFVLKGLSGIKPRLAPHHTLVVDDVLVPIRIHDFPVANQNTDRTLRLVLNPNAVDKDPAPLLGITVFGGKARGRFHHNVVGTFGLHRFKVYPEQIGWYVCR